MRRLVEGRLPADAHAARHSELRARARRVLAITAEQIRSAGGDPADREQLARARAEIDADGEET